MKVEERRCPACRATVSAEAAFCVTCGAPQHHPEPGTTGTPWRALESLWVFLLHLLVTVLIAGVFAVFIAEEDTLAVTTVFINELALIAATLGWVRIRYGAGLATLGLGPVTGAEVGVGLATGLGGIVGAGIITAGLQAILEAIRGRPVEPPQQIELAAEPSGVLLVVLGVSVIVLAPFAEEVFFRGMLFRGLRRWASPWAAIVLSAAIFAVVHIIPFVMLPIFVLGAVLAWVVERRRGLVAAITAHMVFNAVNFVFLLQSGRLS